MSFSLKIMWTVNVLLSFIGGGILYIGISSISSFENSIAELEEGVDRTQEQLEIELRSYINRAIINQEIDKEEDFLISELEFITESLASDNQSESAVILDQVRKNERLTNQLKDFRDSVQSLRVETESKSATITQIEKLVSNEYIGELYLILGNLEDNPDRIVLNNVRMELNVSPKQIKGIGLSFPYLLGEGIELTRDRAMLEVGVYKVKGEDSERLFSYNIPLKGTQDKYISSLYHYKVDFVIGDELRLEKGEEYIFLLEDVQNQLLLSRNRIEFKK